MYSKARMMRAAFPERNRLCSIPGVERIDFMQACRSVEYEGIVASCEEMCNVPPGIELAIRSRWRKGKVNVDVVGHKRRGHVQGM